MDAELSAGIVCFEATGLQAPEILTQLRDENISASVTPYAQQYLRLGPSIVTSEDDIDKTLSALSRIV